MKPVNTAAIDAVKIAAPKVNLTRFNVARKHVATVVAALQPHAIITTAEQQTEALEVLTVASRVDKAIEKKRKEIKEPYLKAGKLIDEFAKELVADLTPAIDATKKGLLAYEKQEKERLLKVRSEGRIKQLTELGYNLGDDNLFTNPKAGVITLREVQEFDDDKWIEMVNQQVTAMNDAYQQTVLQDYDEGDLSFFSDDAPVEVVNIPLVSKTAAAPAPPALKGVTKRWTFEIIDHKIVPREYMCIDDAAINAAIREGKREIPGVRIYQSENLVVR